MKAFWWSLIGFCVLMCSCKSQKVVSDINVVSKENVQTDVVEYQRIDKVSDVLKVDIDQSKLTIKETIITRIYDKDTGNLTEETTTEREIAQDSDKVVAEAKETEVTEENDVLVKHESDFSKTIESKEKIESIGGQESFGKYFGVSLGVVIGILLLYLLRKILS
jgi:hypothetical protein